MSIMTFSRLRSLLYIDKSNYIKIKISVRKRFIHQCIMPPFSRNYLEPVLQHQRSQKVSLLQTFLRNQIIVMVRRLTEEIKMSMHEFSSIIQVGHLLTISEGYLHFLYFMHLLSQRNYGKINRTSSSMS